MPDRIVISNTSPLYYLHQISCLALLEQLYGRVYYPTAVREELETGRSLGLKIPALDQMEWLIERPVEAKSRRPALVDLGRGEAEVIALGLEHPNRLLILDDQLARRFADLHQLPCTGTLGLLIKAKNRGLIPRIKPLLLQLKGLGMWIAPSLEQLTLQLAEEGE